MTCVECGSVADDRAHGWRASTSDLPPEAELEDAEAAALPAVVALCESSASGEFESGSDWKAGRGKSVLR